MKKLGLLALLLSCGMVFAAGIETFRLEAMDRAHIYGPFELGKGNRVFIGGKAYSLGLSDGKKLSFRSLTTDDLFGPYDFIAGRIIDIGGAHYTLVDIQRIEAPSVVEDKEPPDGADTPTAPSPVKPVHPIKPTPPPGVPPSRPANPVASQPTRPGKPKPQRPAEQRSGWWDATRAGMEVDLIDFALYDVTIGETSESDTAIERQGVSLFFQKAPLKLSVGMTTGGKWSDDATGPPATFENAEISDGQGFLLAVALEHKLYQDRSWKVDVYGELSYLSEDYSLDYGAWVETAIFVLGTTNSEERVDVVTDYQTLNDDITLTELDVRLGTRLTYDSADWWAYGSLEVLAIAETDIDGAVTVRDQSYDIKFERTLPLSAVGGFGLKLGEVRLYLEGEAGADQRISIGAAYEWR